jgi:hypothetical protein
LAVDNTGLAQRVGLHFRHCLQRVV